MLKVFWLDACDPLPIVGNFCPRLDKSIKNDVPVEIYDADPRKAISLFCLDALAVESEDLRLLPALAALVKHRVKKNLASRVEGTH